LVWIVLLYFIVGVVGDILITLYYLAITDRRAAMAAFWSFIITMVQVFVLYKLVLSEEFILGLSAYAVGAAVGTYYTIKYNKQSRKLYKTLLKKVMCIKK